MDDQILDGLISFGQFKGLSIRVMVSALKGQILIRPTNGSRKDEIFSMSELRSYWKWLWNRDFGQMHQSSILRTYLHDLVYDNAECANTAPGNNTDKPGEDEFVDKLIDALAVKILQRLNL